MYITEVYTTENLSMFQCGTILHDSISGALRASGRSFGGWCNENGICQTLARSATFGQHSGPKGTALLHRLIAAAGVETVTVSYRYRMQAETAKLAQQPAQDAA